MNTQAKMVLRIVEDMLNHAAGDLTPQLDDVAYELRKQIRGRHEEALARVRASLPAVLDALTEDGWFWAKVTDYYVETYRGLPGDEKHPRTAAEIVRCVAGAGHPVPTAAIHFCPTDNCVLIMQKLLQDGKSGERKVDKTVDRMRAMAESGALTPDGIETIAVNANLAPRKAITKAMRIAASVNQKRLALASGE